MTARPLPDGITAAIARLERAAVAQETCFDNGAVAANSAYDQALAALEALIAAHLPPVSA